MKMIELKTSYSLSQIPYITYEALDDYAEALVRDFSPEHMCAPVQIDVDRFLEYYLGLNLDFHRICYDRKILGLTAFNDGLICVLNEDTGKPMDIPIKTGTVIIDPSLSKKRSIHRLRFTMMHEGSHWLIHKKAFSQDNPYGKVGILENQYLAAKVGRIDYSRSLKENTENERMERQADFLSSAILMPRSTLRMAFCDFFKLYGEKPRRIVRGKSQLDDCFAVQLPKYIAGVFNVSARAALIRLEKLTAIVNKGWQFV
jgi:Zn-dependent peptidase ImmA (M78 family)